MANQIFKGDDLLTIELDTGYADLALASAMKIYWQAPDGTKGFWPALQVGLTTKIYYEVADGDFDQTGTYLLQAGITAGSDRESLGTIVKVKVVSNIK